MKIKNTDTNEIVEIKLIDPKTGCCYFGEIAEGSVLTERYDAENNCFLADTETIDWWEGYAGKKQEADEVFQRVINLYKSKVGHSESQEEEEAFYKDLNEAVILNSDIDTEVHHQYNVCDRVLAMADAVMLDGYCSEYNRRDTPDWFSILRHIKGWVAFSHPSVDASGSFNYYIFRDEHSARTKTVMTFLNTRRDRVKELYEEIDGEFYELEDTYISQEMEHFEDRSEPVEVLKVKAGSKPVSWKELLEQL